MKMKNILALLVTISLKFKTMKEVIIIQDDWGFTIYEESGQALECDFENYDLAEDFAKNQNWKVVEHFNIK